MSDPFGGRKIQTVKITVKGTMDDGRTATIETADLDVSKALGLRPFGRCSYGVNYPEAWTEDLGIFMESSFHRGKPYFTLDISLPAVGLDGGEDRHLFTMTVQGKDPDA